MTDIRLPAGWTFAALLAGLALGWALSGGPAAETAAAIAGPVGSIWLRGLQMTIVPLVAALLVTGIVRMVATARAGPMARRTLLTFLVVLAAGTLFAAFVTPALLEAFPIPGRAAAALAAENAAAQTVPGIGAFFESLVADNVLAAAAETAMLPLAVALVRATGPAMNLGVAIYVAKLAGVPLTPGAIAAGVAVALATTIGSVSLPGAISFVTAIGPIAIAMGVPIEPLAILVAVEMLPDIMRTLGNVTMDVAVTSRVERTTPTSA